MGGAEPSFQLHVRLMKLRKQTTLEASVVSLALLDWLVLLSGVAQSASTRSDWWRAVLLAQGKTSLESRRGGGGINRTVTSVLRLEEAITGVIVSAISQALVDKLARCRCGVAKPAETRGRLGRGRGCWEGRREEVIEM